MTPIEKAKELVNKFIQYSDGVPDDYDWQDPVEYSEEKEFSSAKQCALIAVDEILESQPSVILVPIDGDETEYMDKKQYWKQVRNEIEQL